MLDFVRLYPQVLDYLPVDKEVKKLSRSYLGNVIYTIVGDPFKEWVDAKIKERHAKIKEQQDMLVSLDPDIARIFSESTAVSVSKGNSAHLMKFSAQRRRTRQEIQLEKQLKVQKQIEIDKKLAELEKIKQEWAAVQHKIDMAQHVEEQFQALHSQGKMKMSEDGHVHIVDDPEEQKIIAETARKNRDMEAKPIQDSEQIRDEVRLNLLDKLNQVIDDVDEDEFE